MSSPLDSTDHIIHQFFHGDTPIAGPSTPLQRRKAIRSKAQHVPLSPRLGHVPGRQCTVLRVITPEAYNNRLSIDSTHSSSSIASTSTTSSSTSLDSNATTSSAASVPMPTTPPPGRVKLQIQTLPKVLAPIRPPKLRSIHIRRYTSLDRSPLTSPVALVPSYPIYEKSRKASRGDSLDSTYSQPSLSDHPYDIERSKVIRLGMARDLMNRNRNRSKRQGTGDSLEVGATPASIRSEDWLWDRHFRYGEWEKLELQNLVAERKSDMEAKMAEGYREWQEELTV